jgi:hypothetical protein
MKNKLTKIWGIGMIVVLMASLLIVGATPASAATLAYSAQAIPGVALNQVAGGTDVALVRVAPNGDIFAVDATATTDIYKSVDGGRTWGALPVTLAGAIADLKISPAYETDSTVIALANVAGNAVVYISENAGITYNALGAQVAAGEVGTSVAIAPNYNGAGQIMVGTSIAAAGFGDVYIWGLPATPYVWAAQNLGGAGGLEDVTAVAFSPNYQLDFTVLAIGSTAANTFLHTNVIGGAGWDGNVGTLAPATITTITPLAIQAPGTGGGQDIVSADLVLPSDFRANVYPSNCIAYAAIRSQNGDDKVYRVLAGGGAAGASVPMDPNAPPGFAAAGDDEVTSLAYSGTTLAGTLVAGYGDVAGGDNAAVYRTDNPGSTLVSWARAVKQPTGVGEGAGTQLTYVALPPDFATSNTIYAGTGGQGGAGVVNSALSVSVDGGVTFNQYGLVDTAIKTIDDFVAASATELYLVTNNAAGTYASVWKSADGGLAWTRVYAGVAAAANTAIIRLSPTYATDGTVIFGNGLLAAGNLQLSSDGGNLWVPLNCPIAPNDIAVKDAYTFYVGGPLSVDVTVNGGWTWQIPGPTAVAGGVNDIELDIGTGHLLVGTNAGTVMRSTDNNLTYRAQGATLDAAAGTGVITVAFDSNYANNSMIYAADTQAAPPVAGVQRLNVTSLPGTAWTVIAAGAALCQDIISAPDGTLYASDATALGGMQRSLNPTSGPPAPLPAFEAVAAGDRLPAGASLTTLSRVDGSNVIYAINAVAVPGILTYTDILTGAVPTIVTPSEGDIVLAGAATVTIEPIPDNVGGTYQVQWNTRADWLGVGNVIPFTPTNTLNLNDLGLTGTVPGTALPAGATIYLRVRATGTVFGPWSDVISFETQLTAGAINAPAILSPSENGTGPGGWDAELNPTFTWGVIGGATSYLFQLATDAGMADLIVDENLGNVLVYTLTSMTLDYNTTYYWRVMAISATSETDWSAVVGFTTMAEPAEEEPPVTITEQPQATIVVEIPEATTTEVVVETEEVAQGYIWAIIIIGAVLVIAVIVLIVRTRRSV